MLKEQNACFSCSNCDRKVLDLRGKNAEEIQTVLANQTETCIMIDDNRDPYHDHQKIHRLRAFLVASVLVFGSTLYCNAKELNDNLLGRYEILEKDTSELYGFQFRIFPRFKRSYGNKRRGGFMPEESGWREGKILKEIDRVTVSCDSLNFKQTLDDIYVDENGWLMLNLSDLPVGDTSLEYSNEAILVFEFPGYKPVRFHLSYLQKGMNNSRYIFRENQREPRFRRRIGTYI